VRDSLRNLRAEKLKFTDLKKKSVFVPRVRRMSGVRKYMRVEIKLSLLELHFNTEGRINLFELNNSDSILVTNIRGEFILRRNGNEIEILHPGNKYWGSVKGYLILKSRNVKNIIELDELGYRGSMEIRFTDNGGLSVINQLNLEEYTRDVLPYEMPAGDKAILEALKAQAVAARTYALSHQNQFKKLGFDVYADSRDQVYKGVKAESFLSDKAVRETANNVMFYKDELAACYYHSTCGGKTANLHEVWIQRDPIDYLRSIDDSDPVSGNIYCKNSKYIRWYEKWDRKKLAKIIKDNQVAAKWLKPRDFSQIIDISIQDTTKSGRVKVLKVVTDKGVITFDGDKTRWALKRDLHGYPILLSSWFTIVKKTKEILIEGRGFGHGIGMCQMGAMERARQGASYSEILFSYYPGTQIVLLQ